MSAIVRVCWLFFSAFPVQRWLGVLGTALLAVGLGAAVLGIDWRVSVMLGVIAFAICVLFPAAFAAGGVLRALSAPHNHQFLPLFRVRVLLATGLLMALLLAPVCFMFFVPPASNGEAPPLQAVAFAFQAVVFAFGAVTAILLAMFVITGNWNRMFLVLPLLFALTLWLRLEGPLRLRDAGISIAALVGPAGTGAWLIFVVWYLRVRRIRPPMLTPVGRFSRQLGPAEMPSRATAGRAVMNGVIEVSPTKMLLRAIGLGLAIGATLALVAYLARSQNRTPSFTTFIWPFVMMTATAETTYRFVRQSRLLWLQVPGSRADVLRVVEAAMGRRYLWQTAFNLSLFATLLALQGPALRDVGWALALALSAALYGSYVGLAAVRGLGLLIVGCGPMAIAQIAVLGTSGATTALEFTALLAVQLLGAVVFRLLGAQRWRRMDWMRFRPLGNNIF
jgi:hypothetical protein